MIAEGTEDGILGREREVHLAITSGPGTVLVAFGEANASISTPVDTSATATLTYDGTANVDPACRGRCGRSVLREHLQGPHPGRQHQRLQVGHHQDDTLGNLTVTVWKGNSSGQTAP